MAHKRYDYVVRERGWESIVILPLFFFKLNYIFQKSLVYPKIVSIVVASTD